ncbi:hypothetical protein HN51_000090 [Arachis hypogaea]|uniref:uncharacterized protein n=1 Tax=Arachis hypogaea TaxID=3818 RepID=UPI000DECE31B|nr:uncharacterized protein LOC112789445 [Arachis hypogaea]XP_025687137.1 uncharacterized protein LOC112789445 [Arachis hypogaea]QHO47883.1 uncharacterized protein DS421_1g01010 [Arachis hypogaea]
MCYPTTLTVLCAAFLLQIPSIASIPVPSSNCYTFDNSSRIVDFTSWIGYLFEYDVKEGTDLAVRFCKDVESRSQTGYVDFGRFDKYNYFVAGSHESDFVQEFYNGDLMGCEQSYDKMGRTAQVNIICGSCLNGQCKGRPGCICNVTYESNCRVSVELALPCEKPGPQVFQGFTVGFHPRSWEIVYNGMTQFGFEKPNRDFSFDAGQSQVVLFMTAVASHSSLVGKPSLKVLPEKGLEIRLSGSANHGKPPTTLSPTMLIVDWRCEVVRDTPYEVNITIPIEGYESIEFVLTKLCDYTQEEGEDARKGWAIFGVLSCIFFVSSTLFCCGGFIYKTKVERQRGIDALPGMTILSACLETISGAGQSYMRPEEQNSAFGGEASWERPPPSSSQGVWRQAERRYGSI